MTYNINQILTIHAHEELSDALKDITKNQQQEILYALGFADWDTLTDVVDNQQPFLVSIGGVEFGEISLLAHSFLVKKYNLMIDSDRYYLTDEMKQDLQKIFPDATIPKGAETIGLVCQ